jgi:3D (Asp-Asp-Asp) domain-containing protein
LQPVGNCWAKDESLDACDTVEFGPVSKSDGKDEISLDCEAQGPMVFGLADEGSSGIPEAVNSEAEVEQAGAEGAKLPGTKALVFHPEIMVRPNVIDGRSVWELLVKDQVALRIRTQYGGLGARERAETVAARLSAVLYTKSSDPFLSGERNGEVVVLSGSSLIVTVDPEVARLNDSSPEFLSILWCENLNTILGRPNPIKARRTPETSRGGYKIVRTFEGLASWYGPGFHGKRTASGERFDQWALTAAHTSLPFGTRVLVTNTKTLTSIVVRINDRGPWVKGRIVDLSRKAAEEVGIFERGIGMVRLDVLE